MASIVFDILNFALAALMYTLLGRLLLGLVLPSDSGNIIMRFFVGLTQPVVAAVAVATPRIVPEGLLVALAFVWAFFARVLLFFTLAAFGAFGEPV